MADIEVTADAKIAMMGEMAQYVLGLVEQRRERPAEDLLSRLIHADLDGERLDDLELVVNFAQLMAGGNETTRNAFAGGMLALIEHPGERQKLLEDPSLIPGAVEEILRWHTPIMHNLRTATRDTVIRGVEIKEGQRVAVWHVSGNRDEDVYEEPHAFRVDRPQVRHLSFNGGGKHFCIGNQLARLELRICFEETLRRLPDLELAGPVRRKPSHNFHWMEAMPVTFAPAARAD
jgi:cytochrome P450